MSRANRLLILDDDPAGLQALAEAGRLCRYEVAAVGSSADLPAIYDRFNPSVIVLNVWRDQGDSLEAMAFLKQRGCRVPILLTTGLDVAALAAARRVGRARGLAIAGASVKPVSPGVIEPFLEAHRELELDEWAEALQASIDRDEIEVVYQPKVRLEDARPVGVEALARWTHPSRGAISPERFIAIADATRLIERLTDRVVERAIADCAGWMAAGHDLTVAINLPAPSLTCEHLIERLVNVLHAHGLSPASVTIEVTESAAIREPLLTSAVLSRLRLRGFTLAIDDFGVGYSGFSRLHQMPFNELKIDRSVIADLADSRTCQVIVQTLATLARHLGMRTVVEGVEQLEIWGWLRAAGIEQAQGFGIARPMPANQVPVWLATWPHIAPP